MSVSIIGLALVQSALRTENSFQALTTLREGCALICRCDKEGRMAGGLASLPGFGWVPLKVYRPCPELAKAGISYVRRASGAVLICAVCFILQRVSAYVVEGRPAGH